MNSGPFDNNQFIVSYELLHLLRWLLEAEQESIKKIIKKAINSNFIEKNIQGLESDQDLQLAIIDFFTMLEVLIYESLHEENIKKVFEKDLIPEINHIDSKIYDNYDFNILNASISKAKNNLDNTLSAKEVFCRELLKRWKPSKKTIIN